MSRKKGIVTFGSSSGIYLFYVERQISLRYCVLNAKILKCSNELELMYLLIAISAYNGEMVFLSEGASTEPS